jgi:hypothetical protein
MLGKEPESKPHEINAAPQHCLIINLISKEDKYDIACKALKVFHANRIGYSVCNFGGFGG